MKLFRVLAALAALCAPAGATEQSSYVWPLGTVPGSNSLGALTANYYNPALRALASCNNGPTPPANGPGGAPLLGQCWFDTSASPSVVLRYFDGSQWPGLSTLDASTHAWAISVASPVRTVTGTSDSLFESDRGKLVDVANASTVSFTLAPAGAAGSFSSGWYVTVRNSGAGNATITPTTSTIDGVASIPVRPGQSLVIRSDGTNYKTDLPQQPWNANLAGIAGLTSAADRCQYWTGAGTAALMDCLSWSRAVTGAASASAGRTAFGLAIGTDVQAYNANLAAFAGLTGAVGKVLYFTGPAATAMFDSTSFGRSISNAADAAALRTLAGSVIGTNVQAQDADLDCLAALSTTGVVSRTGAGTCAVRAITGTANQIAVANGDGVAGPPTLSIPLNAALPGAPTTTTASSGDNTTKIATTAYADAIAALKANLASPALTGAPTAPTAAVDTNTTQLATTSYVLGQASAAGDGTPAMNGTAARGTGTHFARNDHVHPTDSTRAPLASPALTGAPTAPTASPSTNSTQIATTAYADSIAALKANSIRNIATGCGLAGGGDLSADRTLRLNLTINAQTSTSYSVVDGDCGKLITLKNASPVSVTLPQANGGTFVSGWSVDFQNKGAGLVTVTSVTSTINDGASISLSQNQGMHCRSDGANYACELGVGAGGGSGTLTLVATGDGLVGGPITATGTLTVDPSIMRGYLSGLTLSTAGGSGTFAVTPGVAVDSGNAAFMKLASAYTKTTSAWAVGSGNGSLDTGTIANSTWYHVHQIKRPDTGVVDMLLSLSATAPTLPANYTLARRIGSLKTNGSAQWVKFVQMGDEFLWDVPVLDINFAGTTAIQAATITVPTGLKVNALMSAAGIGPGTGAGQGRAWIFSPDVNSAGALAGTSNFNVGIFTSAPGSQNWGSINVRTSTAAQVYFSTEISSMSLQGMTYGWVDRRGRDN